MVALEYRKVLGVQKDLSWDFSSTEPKPVEAAHAVIATVGMHEDEAQDHLLQEAAAVRAMHL
jgi:hypothetical protein